MKSQIVIILIFVIIIAFSLVLRIYSDSRVKNFRELEEAINEYVHEDIFVTRLENQHLNKLYSTEESDRLFVEMAGRPINLFEGLGKDYLQNCLQLINKKQGKKIKGIQINQTIKEDYINIYFFDDDPKGYFKEFKNNCAYTKYKNVIVCDIKYVTDFQFVNEISSSLEEMDTSNIDAEYKSMILMGKFRALSSTTYNLLWIVGHEIGHIANNHEYSHFNFQDLVNQDDSTTYYQEIEADNFTIEAIQGARDTELAIGDNMIFGLSNILQFYHMKSCYLKENHTIDKCTGALNVTPLSSTHPHMFIRATDFLIKLDSIYLLNNQRYLRDLKQRIKIINNENS